MRDHTPLTQTELDALTIEELPERAAMSLINVQAAVPVNAAVSANVLTNQSTSSAGAGQSGNIGQLGF